MSDRRRAGQASTTSARRAPARGQATAGQRRWLPALAVGAGVLAVGLLLAGGFTGGGATAGGYTCAAIRPVPQGSVPPGGIVTDNLGSDHVPAGQTIDYALCPPASSNHYSARGVAPLRPGFYGPDDNASPGAWVHNLEHGFAVVLYRGGPDAPDAATLEQLEAFAANGPPTESAAACGYRSKVLVARFDDMPTPFSVLAWDRWLPMTEWNEAAARSFAEGAIDTTAREPNAC